MADNDNVIQLHTPIEDEIMKVFEDYDDILIVGSSDTNIAVVSNVGGADGMVLLEAAKLQLLQAWMGK